ncbi:hypothetical protein QQP08_002380 [Theobroma cacao]|nr:hypothetical protein QQP08_002380 [Theobroma cacao]
MARLTKFTLTCAILASLTSFLVGLQYGELGNETGDLFMKNNERKIETFLTFSSIFHFLAPLAAGTLSDLIGRRYSLLLSPIFFSFGYLVTSLAPNYVVFVTGYLLVDTRISFALAVTHVYITE